MSTLAIINSTFQPVHVGKVPSEPKAIALDFDFTNTPSWDVDLTQQQQQSKIEFIQSLFIDNSANTAVLTITNPNTGQVIVFPHSSQGYIPFLCPNPPRFTVSTTQAAIKVHIQAQNFVTDSITWLSL